MFSVASFRVDKKMRFRAVSVFCRKRGDQKIKSFTCNASFILKFIYDIVGFLGFSIIYKYRKPGRRLRKRKRIEIKLQKRGFVSIFR